MSSGYLYLYLPKMNLLFQQLHKLAPGIFLKQTLVLYQHGQSFCSCQTATVAEIHVLKPAIWLKRATKAKTKTKCWCKAASISDQSLWLSLRGGGLDWIWLIFTASEPQILTKTKEFLQVLCQDMKIRSPGKHRSGGLMSLCLCQLCLQQNRDAAQDTSTGSELPPAAVIKSNRLP